MTRLDHDASLVDLTTAIVRECAPERVVLFGSRARGDQRPDSDYDILVVAESGTERLREKLGCRYRVDVMIHTPGDFERRRFDVGTMAYVIDREGRVLYDRDPAARDPRISESSAHPPKSFHEWMTRASNDFRLMELAAREVPDGTCFHAHQSAEKFLKAALVFAHTPPPRTHTLTELLRLCPVDLRSDPSLRSACEALDGVYDKSRYSDCPLPTPSEVTASVAAARIVRAAVDAFTSSA